MIALSEEDAEALGSSMSSTPCWLNQNEFITLTLTRVTPIGDEPKKLKVVVGEDLADEGILFEDEEPEPMLFAGTPDTTVFSLQLPFAAEDPEHVAGLIDAESAYYQSPALRQADGSLPVMPPPAYVEPPGSIGE